MHELFSQVLNRKDLSKAGDLFQIPDSQLLINSNNDLNEVIRKINEICSSRSYLINDNDQSVVEIVLARVTCSIRDLSTIEKHIYSLVTLLNTCLNNDLHVHKSPQGRNFEPPHSKIASDILALLFLNYNKYKVMKLTLPIAVKFLHKSNPNLLRSISSYLPLASIEFPELLSKHAQIIIDSIISGNYSLLRVLPQIYPLSHERINEHVMALANLLQNCEDFEKLALLNLFVYVAEAFPYLLEPCLPQLSLHCLGSRATTYAVFQVFYAMCKRSNLVSDYLDKIEKSGYNCIELAIDVVCEIGLHCKPKAYQALNILIKYLHTFKEAQAKLTINITKLLEMNDELITDDLIFEVARYRSLVENLRLLRMKRNSRNLRPIISSYQHKSLTRLNYKGSPIKYPYASQLTIKSSGSLLNNDSTYSIYLPTFKKHHSLSSSLNETSAPIKNLPPTFTPAAPVKELKYETVENNRISVFEPYPMRDTVQHFCEKHLDKIKSYVDKILVPLPVKCTIEERKSRKNAKLHFSCNIGSASCIYSSGLFSMKTENARIWIHIMFLALQARSSQALSTRESSVSALKNCWDVLKSENKSFLTLVTSAFPSINDQDLLLQELRNTGYLDIFEFRSNWGCFVCQNPERLKLWGEKPILEGQLKEKKGKWKLFRRWRTKYFTLSGGVLSSNDDSSLSLNQIRTVRVSRGSRNIPKAFEIFTDENSYILKPKDGREAEDWVKCISILMGQAKTNGKCVSLSGLKNVGSN